MFKTVRYMWNKISISQYLSLNLVINYTRTPKALYSMVMVRIVVLQLIFLDIERKERCVDETVFYNSK